MSYGAYYGTQPSTRTYVDTSQPLNGFGAFPSEDGKLAIYDGVAGFGAAPSSCGCAGTRGRLAGFGDEVMPDGTSTDTSLTPDVTMGTNIQTALVALLVVGSIAAVGYYFLGGSKGGTALRANGRKRRRGKRMRRNGKAIPMGGERSQRALHRKLTETIAELGYNEAKALRQTYWHAVLDESDRTGHAASAVKQRSIALDFANGVAKTYGVTPKNREVFLKAFMHGLRMPGKPHHPLRRNGSGVPAYLLKKKGRTGVRQAHAAAHYLAEARWHGAPKRVRHWSGKHLAHHRFHTNSRAPRVGDLVLVRSVGTGLGTWKGKVVRLSGSPQYGVGGDGRSVFSVVPTSPGSREARFYRGRVWEGTGWNVSLRKAR